MTRFNKEELLGKDPETMLLPSDELKQEMREHNNNRSSGLAEVYQIQLKRKDGVVRTVLISGAPLVDQDNMIVGSAGIHWDITPMLEMESRLHEKEVMRQRNILQASIRSEEKQKQTLGRELHDGLGQLLAYISLNMQILLDTNHNAQDIVLKTKELMNNAIAEVRQLSRTLIPVALDNTKQLKEIIHESLVMYANLKGILFDIETRDELVDQKLSLDQKHIVFRILQELTNNTIKYADATKISVSIFYKNKNCHFEYTDNGKGFNTTKIKKGVGFESMNTRIESYNGQIHLQSKPGKGMKATFSLPVEIEEKKGIY
jgi:PAS domain S-box-containing protein